MKKLMAIIACGVLVGCDYSVPLVTTPELAIDSGIVGVWQRSKDNGKTESLLVLPLNKREYLVSFPAGSKESMFARACLCRSAGKTLVQLEWIGNAQGDWIGKDQSDKPEDKRVFQFATYSVTGDTITIRLLSTDLVKKDVTSSKALAKAIAANKDNPDLFHEEMVFKRVKN